MEQYKEYRALCKKLMSGPLEKIDEEVLDDVWDRYSEDWRVYHGVGHLLGCLNSLNEYPGDTPPEVFLSVLYHDAVYIPGDKDNEFKSAELAKHTLSRYEGIDIDTIYTAILATKHDKMHEGRVIGLVCDIDLASSLGAEFSIFEKYALDIEKEYGIYGKADYEHKRSSFLQHTFLDREKIFVTDYFYENYEQRARENLAIEIDRLLKTEDY